MMWTLVGIDAQINHRREQALRHADERRLATVATVRRRRTKGRRRLRPLRTRSFTR